MKYRGTNTKNSERRGTSQATIFLIEAYYRTVVNRVVLWTTLHLQIARLILNRAIVKEAFR